MLVTKLLKYVPNHTYYLEAYGGSAALLFSKKPSEFEVYNDIDSGLVNFFRVLRDPEKFEKFYRKVSLTPYSREEFNFCRKTWANVEDEVERAYRFFVVARMSFGGNFAQGWGFSVKTISKNLPSEVSKWLSAIETLPEFHQRIMQVQIENLPAIECIEKYGSAWNYDNSFIYLDPPYLPSTRRKGKYRYEMTYKDHEELVNYLIETRTRNKYMLSGYDNDLYRKLEENGFKKICWDIGCSAVGRTRQLNIWSKNATRKFNQRRIDCIWINYDI